MTYNTRNWAVRAGGGTADAPPGRLNTSEIEVR